MNTNNIAMNGHTMLMFETEFLWTPDFTDTLTASSLPFTGLRSSLLLNWENHCFQMMLNSQILLAVFYHLEAIQACGHIITF
jgi:hypothetical protein